MNPKKLVRKILPRSTMRAAENSYRMSRAAALQVVNRLPAKNLRIIAVTGTNGKTTTCCYINELLKAAGYRTALYSTAVIELNGKSKINLTHRTVPLTAELIGFLAAAKKADVDFVVLETTSMALDQHKLIGVPIEIAIMTNLSQDHLDYHKTMEQYAAAKARLFNKYKHPKHTILNRDDAWFAYFAKQSAVPPITYGESKEADVTISKVRLGVERSTWQVAEHGKRHELTTYLPGRFNVQNATAAAALGVVLGMTEPQLQKGIAALKKVPGRMESIEAGQAFAVLVDYAHTPDALHEALVAVRTLATKRVIVVFGATGDRDKSKRPVMGEVAAKMADLSYLTDDEPYTEDPTKIRAAVRKGLASNHGKYVEVGDRLEAIKQAFKEAKKGDVVLLTGIGHQDSRSINGQQVPWDEREVARRVLKEQVL